jgi:anti-sigma factor RsiW
MTKENEQVPNPSEVEARLDRAEAFIWALLDDQLSEAEMAELSKLLEENAAVRARYVECVQLHVDLAEHYGRKTAEKAPGSVVLSNLTPGLPGPQGLPQIVD